jgi:hypothetical protein
MSGHTVEKVTHRENIVRTHEYAIPIWNGTVMALCAFARSLLDLAMQIRHVNEIRPGTRHSSTAVPIKAENMTKLTKKPPPDGKKIHLILFLKLPRLCAFATASRLVSPKAGKIIMISTRYT